MSKSGVCEYFGGRCPAEAFSWPVIQNAHGVGDFFLADVSEVRSSVEEFTHKTVQILNGAFLPRAVRGAEVKRDIQFIFHLSIAIEFNALVCGKGQARHRFRYRCQNFVYSPVTLCITQKEQHAISAFSVAH